MRRSFFVLLSVAALIAGCAGLDAGSSSDVRARADEVARRRLAAGLAIEVDGVTAVASFRLLRLAADNVAEPPGPVANDAPGSPEGLPPAAPVEGDSSLPPPGNSPHTDAGDVVRGPLPGFRDTLRRDIKELPEVLWEDTKSVYTNPYNLIFLLGAGGASAALRPEVDDDIEDYYDDHHSLKADWRDAFGAAGNPITHFALAGAWYLAGQQLQDAKTYEVGKRSVSALTITGVTTVLLKLAANTESPNGEQWAWPSGHVSSTMAFATVLNGAYGPLVGVPMFGLTGLVALERMDSGEHHFSDVVFGAALGWVVAETVVKEHRPEIFGGQIVPYVDPNGPSAGIAWVKTLGHD